MYIESLRHRSVQGHVSTLTLLQSLSGAGMCMRTTCSSSVSFHSRSFSIECIVCCSDQLVARSGKLVCDCCGLESTLNCGSLISEGAACQAEA